MNQHLKENKIQKRVVIKGTIEEYEHFWFSEATNDRTLAGLLWAPWTLVYLKDYPADHKLVAIFERPC